MWSFEYDPALPATSYDQYMQIYRQVQLEAWRITLNSCTPITANMNCRR